MLRPGRLAVLIVALLCSCSKGSNSPTSPGGGGGTNHAPTVYITADSTRIDNGHSCTVHATASDVDGDQLTFGYSAIGGTVTASGNTATTAAFVASSIGNASITVTASDGHGGQATATAGVYVLRPNAPVITPTFPQQFCSYTFSVAETLIVKDYAFFKAADNTIWDVDIALPTTLLPGQRVFSPNFGGAGRDCNTSPMNTLHMNVQRPLPDGRTYGFVLAMH